MALYKDLYRVESTRLHTWDYTATGYYFVTTCAKERRCWFGGIIDDRVALSSIGRIVEEEWLRAEAVRDNVRLDEFVIMPNHVHGIISIEGASFETRLRGVSTPGLAAGSLGAIMRQFKSNATRRIWAAGHREFAWQSRFHDRIVRNERELNAMREYILVNPRKWAEDKEYPGRRVA
jgi:REP element-mobilizing transposase RayT